MNLALTLYAISPMVDRLDQDAIKMENTRRRIADAFGESHYEF
jgi:hypothetical protein